MELSGDGIFVDGYEVTTHIDYGVMRADNYVQQYEGHLEMCSCQVDDMPADDYERNRFVYEILRECIDDDYWISVRYNAGAQTSRATVIEFPKLLSAVSAWMTLLEHENQLLDDALDCTSACTLAKGQVDCVLHRVRIHGGGIDVNFRQRLTSQCAQGGSYTVLVPACTGVATTTMLRDLLVYILPPQHGAQSLLKAMPSREYGVDALCDDMETSGL
jgi:hypothetical protein